MRARAMALGSLSQHRNETKVADFCSAPVDGSYAAVDKPRLQRLPTMKPGEFLTTTNEI